MNMKVVSMCLICAGALLTGCGNGGKKEAETSERKEKEAVVGSDKDEHGCIASAGYTWSEVQKDCIRLWEKGVRMNAVDDAGKTLFLVFSPDSTQVELFFLGGRCFERNSGPSRSACRWICLECGR